MIKVPLLVFSLTLGLHGWAQDSRPNVLLLVADDLGYSDLGSYGGEIRTPAIDRLAENGLRFQQFRVNQMCVVTRTSLMTGQPHSQSNQYRRSVPIAQYFRRAGYHTSISGKWHQPGNPLDAGFQEFYGFLMGEIDCFAGTQPGLPGPVIQSNRQAPRPVPPGWYSTDAFTDHALKNIRKAVAEKKPFFAYVPFNAPHGPIQAPRESIAPYLNTYTRGWEVMRQERFDRLRTLGLIDDRYILSAPHAEVRKWEELDNATRFTESKRMAAYAGMVERIDQNVARLIDELEAQGVLGNTLILFFSDNGGDYAHGNPAESGREQPWRAGNPRPAFANGWAMMKNTPYRWYKSSAFEGGVASPLILHWPDQLGEQAGKILPHWVHVTDLYPTFLELLGETYPPAQSKKNLAPLYGSSINPILKDPTLPKRIIHHEIFWDFKDVSRGFMKHEWKIASINESPWKLFNLEKDPTEAVDLSAERPEKVAELSSAWYRFAKAEARQSDVWNRPLNDSEQGWGYHRLKMVLPLQNISPPSSAMGVRAVTEIVMSFSQPLSFRNTDNRSIRLFEVGQPDSPVYQQDPDPSHPAEGSREFRFGPLPELKPDTTYYLTTDPGWIRVGGTPAGAVNDGSFWYRFRTAAE